jgi:hypothetical protein
MLYSFGPDTPYMHTRRLGRNYFMFAEFEDLDTRSMIVGIDEAVEFCMLHPSARRIASRTGSTLN